MSAIRNPATITSVGRRMMTAGGDITYTKAVLYGQDISHLTREQLESLTSIGNPLVTVPLGISDKNDNGNGTTVILEATFQNSNLKADLPYTAVGFFAKRGDDAEKLIAVGVATEGAYLAATSPDGVATDALDIKVAIAIGDSANVTAMIDPAGSVTPAALHNAITDVKSEMKTGLDTKADKSTVDSDVKSINDTLATKADKQTVTDDLVKKADKTDVDAQIGTVNKSVSDLSDTVKANKDDTDKVLATKADKATVESELSTKANQSDLDKTNAEVAKKASTTDVNSQLATKADAKDVTDALALKDDTVDVDKKISNVTNSVNSLSSTVTSNKSATDTALGTKANANDVANSFEEVRNRVKKLEGQQELTAPDFNTLTSTGIYMIENPTNGKNSPSNGNWGTLVVSRGTTGSDSRILQEYYPDSGDLPYFRMSGPGGVWRDWKQLSDQSEINSLRDAVNTKADKTDVAKDIDTVNKSISSMSATITANQKATDTALDTKADKATVNSDIKTINDTMATKASQSDLDKTNATVATKADKTTVDGDVKTLQASIDTKADKTALDDYAKSADVASDVKTLTDSIATKADAKTVNDAISKIDFTPYAKSADVDSKLKGYTDTADLTKLLAGKADSDFSYSKAELDKKLLDLTTTTGGKVDASQVATMIENKADKSDVTKQIGTVTDLVNTKANSTDVTAALDKKDDITDVDAKIKKVTDLANKAQSTADSKVKSNWAIDNSNGKFVAANVPANGTATQSFTQTGLDLLNTLATKSQVADAKNTANQAIDDYNKRPVIRGNDGDDLLAYKTNQLRLYVDVKNCKNLPPASNTQRFTVEYIFENPNGDGVAIFRSPASEVWLNGNNGGNYNNWLRLANAGDITNLQNAINAKANSSDVYSKSDVDYRTHGTIVTDYDIASLTPTKENNNYRNRWLVDQNVLPKFAEQINQLKGRQNVDAPDFNNLTDTGVYYVSDSKYKGMTNGPNNNWGVLVVLNGSNNRISQVYYPDTDVPPWMRVKNDTWHNWIQLGTNGDIQTAANLANAASNKVDTVLANSYFRKQGMDANGNCVEIRGNAIKQSNGGYAFDIWPNDWTAPKLKDVLGQLPSKANTTDVNNALNGKANTSDVTALQQTIKTLNDTLSSANTTIKTLQDTITKQATQITGLQTQVNNQAQDIAYIKANYIEGKRFAKSDEASATAWEKDNPQRIAFIEDK